MAWGCPWKTPLKSTERSKRHPEGSQERLFIRGTLCKMLAFWQRIEGREEGFGSALKCVPLAGHAGHEVV